MSGVGTTQLGDVAAFVRGITFKPDDVVPVGSPGSVACMRTKNVQADLDLSDVWGIPDSFVKRQDQYLESGDLLVSSANSWNLVGKCCWVPQLPWRATFGGFISVLRGNKMRIDPRYLYHWFGSPRVQATVRSFGQQTTNISNLNVNRCERLEVPLPPLLEQRRIAEILDKADALRAKRRDVLARLHTLAESIFLEMFGDPATNPKGWQKKPFGVVCETRLGKMLDQKQQTGEHRRPYLRNANVQWFRFDLSDVLQMDFDEEDRAVLRLQPGDLLICEGGEPGRAAVWGGEIEECYFQKALHRARPHRTLAVPDYLAWLLWFLAKRGILSGVTSATIAHLTGEKLALLPTMLPPLDLQLQFARRLGGVGSLRRSFGAAATALDTAFVALQHSAFRGEL
jgi:type I restriction enzyme, S subunit